jgi:hypothetical protein
MNSAINVPRRTSISALVGKLLRSRSGGDSEFASLQAQQRAVQQRVARFRAGDCLDRDELHERAVR